MDTINISMDKAVELCSSAFINSGASEHNSRITAKALVRAEADGQKGHGFSRVPSYAAQVKSGKVNGTAKPVLVDVKAGLFRVDADFGFAYPAIGLALPELVTRSQKIGIAAVALALMIEVMSTCLAGTALGTEAGSLFEGEGNPPNLGQVIVAIDARSLSAGSFSARSKDLAAIYDDLDGARLPGTGRLQNRINAAKRGLSVPAPLMEEIKIVISR